MLKVWVVGSSPTMERGSEDSSEFEVAHHPPTRFPDSRGEGRLFQMTSRDALACEIFVDELMVAGCAEAGEVAAVDDGDGQGAETLHRCHIVFAVGMIGVVDEGAVVDNVAGEECAAGFFEEADAAGGMAGGVDDFEMPVAEIYDIAMGQQALGRGGLYPVA